MSAYLSAPSFGRRTQLVVIPATDTILINDDEAPADFAAWKSRRVPGVELCPKITAASALGLLRLRSPHAGLRPWLSNFIEYPSSFILETGMFLPRNTASTCCRLFPSIRLPT
jgi:hypothetical protein